MQRKSAPQPQQHAPGFPQWGSTILLAPLLVVIGLRPLIQETHDSAGTPFTALLTDLRDPLPEVTLWINLVLVVVAGAAITLSIATGKGNYRRTGLEIGLIVAACAALVALATAGNRRLALNATVDWLTLPLITIALVQVLRQRRRQWLVLSVVIASGVASAVESYDQVLVTLPGTIELYDQSKETLWQGTDAGMHSYQAQLFEKRLQERAANGYFAFANIAGSYFIVTLFATAALCAAVWPKRLPVIITASSGVVMAGAMLLTRSRGAGAAAVMGAVVVVILLVLRRPIQRHRRRMFIIGWLIAAAALSAIAGYGLIKGHLPEDSLTYRWWYLETTAEMVKDHPLGIGSEQYGRFYPRYKEIKSPEEIINPHNFLAHSAAEWGIAGLTGVLLMVFACSRRLAGQGDPLPAGVGTAPARDPGARRSQYATLLIGAALAISIWGLRIWIIGSTYPAYVLASNAYGVLAWMIAFGLCTAVLPDDHVPMISARAAAVLGVGVLAFVLHNLITFSFFVPGAATTLFAVLGVAVALRYPAATPVAGRLPAGRLGTITIAATVLAVVCITVWGLIPVTRCRWHLQNARHGSEPDQIRSHYRAAAAADKLDPVAATEWARLGLRYDPAFARFSIAGHPTSAWQVALQRDPERVSVYRLCAASAYQLYERNGSVADLNAAIEYYSEAVSRYPTSPTDRVAMGELQIRLFDATGDGHILAAAIAQLEQALRLDASRPADEVRRFKPARVTELRAKLDQLRHLRPVELPTRPSGQ